MDSLAERVAANIRAEAGRRRVTQTELARALGVSQSIVSLRWRARREWSLSEIEVVARYLRTTTSVLLTGTPARGRGEGERELPRLDSNQQPSD